MPDFRSSPDDEKGRSARTASQRWLVVGAFAFPRAALRALAKSKRKQSRAKQDKTGSGHSQETVRSEFITHGAAPKSSYPLPRVNASFLDHLDRRVSKNQTDQ